MAIKEVKKKTVAKARSASAASSKGAAGVANKDEQIGFHKGALSTLAKEREELIKIVSIVEQLMQMHVSGLKELGVDLEKMARDAEAKAKKSGSKSRPLEASLR